MFAALAHRPVDRMPFSTYNLHPFSPDHANDPWPRTLLRLVSEKAGMLCKCSARQRRPGPDQHGGGYLEAKTEHTPEHTTITRVLRTPKGDLRSVTVKPKDQPALTTEHFIKSDEDIDRYMSLPFEAEDYDISGVLELERNLGDAGMVYVRYADPMHDAAVLFDFNDFAVRCITDMAPVLRLIDFQFERIKAGLANLLAACRGRSFLFYTGGPEICTPPMMPPRVFGRIVTPYQKRLIQMIHEAGMYASLHCHGKVRAVLDEILACGFDSLEPIEPPPQGDMTLAELFDRADGRLCLIGHIQDQELHYAPPGTLTRRVEDIMRVAQGRTGYVMAPTCTPFQHPAAAVFLRNYAEWIEAASRAQQG